MGAVGEQVMGGVAIDRPVWTSGASCLARGRHTRKLAGFAVGAMLAALAPCSPAAASAPTVLRATRLSNETTYTRWAYVAQTGPIYQRPSTHSRRITNLHWYTEDDFPEVYLLLREEWMSDGRVWVELRIPMRPNGRTGWVHRRDLGTFYLTHMLIVVNRSRLRLYLYRDGRRIFSAPVAVGKPSTPTPPGHFWIREGWAIRDRSSGYWPYAFGTSDFSTLTRWPGGGVVGIHGPYHDNAGIPGRISHGCIRMHPRDILWLSRHVGVGTPVRII